MKLKRIVVLMVSALLLTWGGQVFSQQQLDEGTAKSSSKLKFFVGRYGRTNAIGTGGNVISKDRVVVWDSTSNDGVTVNVTTTSHDALIVGVTMDEIPGSSRDNTAVNDLSYANWGRIQVWGRHAGVSWDQSTIANVGNPPAGSRLSASGRAAPGGAIGLYATVSDDSVNVSRDNLGISLNAPAAADKTIDVFLNKG